MRSAIICEITPATASGVSQDPNTYHGAMPTVSPCPGLRADSDVGATRPSRIPDTDLLSSPA